VAHSDSGVRGHWSLEAVEETIDAYALPDDDKDALWLWASGRADRHVVATRTHIQLVPG
jgi:hypothetical protein